MIIYSGNRSLNECKR